MTTSFKESRSSPSHALMPTSLLYVYCSGSVFPSRGVRDRVCLIPLKFPETSHHSLAHLHFCTHPVPLLQQVCTPARAFAVGLPSVSREHSPSGAAVAPMLSALVQLCILGRRVVKMVEPQNGDSGIWSLNLHLKEIRSTHQEFIAARIKLLLCHTTKRGAYLSRTLAVP